MALVDFEHFPNLQYHIGYYSNLRQWQALKIYEFIHTL